ncbi:hypothetical protein N7456_006428 [Penicillium angulare]|uniref:Tryptophan synthase beta chain-like PALP domain-containing protein n=1 Tax=Penicillium angulare TaxID=116970 RepID=A0A9W9FHN7_9EURO|nr:hypothetical protein N7456_006428 [Penicillium angulare]
MANIETCPPLSRASVEAAAHRIKGKTHQTPVMSSRYIDSLASTAQARENLLNSEWNGQEPACPRLHILFKCENFQKIGAFKPRGAFNAILRYEEERKKFLRSSGSESRSLLPIRIISHSSGNHAQAVALAAGELGYEAHIVMPSVSTPAKIAATRGYGATVHFSGSTPQERLAVVDKLMGEEAFENVFVSPYDHPDTLLGQGTLGLELQDQSKILLPDQDLHGIITPCQGTGIQVFGSEPWFEGADDCRRGLCEGKRVEVVRSMSIADGLRTPVGEIPWDVISDPENVKGLFSVTEDQIRDALGLILQQMKIVVEPSSAVPLAVALYNEDFRRLIQNECQVRGLHVYNLGLVVSGGNFDILQLSQMLQ